MEYMNGHIRLKQYTTQAQCVEYFILQYSVCQFDIDKSRFSFSSGMYI